MADAVVSTGLCTTRTGISPPRSSSVAIWADCSKTCRSTSSPYNDWLPVRNQTSRSVGAGTGLLRADAEMFDAAGVATVSDNNATCQGYGEQLVRPKNQGVMLALTTSNRSHEDAPGDSFRLRVSGNWSHLPAAYDAVAGDYAAMFSDELDHKPFDRQLLNALA